MCSTSASKKWECSFTRALIVVVCFIVVNIVIERELRERQREKETAAECDAFPLMFCNFFSKSDRTRERKREREREKERERAMLVVVPLKDARVYCYCDDVCARVL